MKTRQVTSDKEAGGVQSALQAIGPSIKNPESIDLPSSNNNSLSKRPVHNSRSHSPHEKSVRLQEQSRDERAIVKSESNTPRAIACLLIGGVVAVFLADQLWGLLFGFWYGFYLEDPGLGQIGAENMAVVTVDALLIPVLLVLWLAVSLFSLSTDSATINDASLVAYWIDSSGQIRCRQGKAFSRAAC